MITNKGKKSATRVMLTYILFGFVLWVAAEVSLLLWFLKAPQFITFQVCLAILATVVVGYFFIARGFFLNSGSGYEFDGVTFTMIDGYPNQKRITVKPEQIEEVSVKRVKGLFRFGLGKMQINLSDKKYLLKNVNYEELVALSEKIKSATTHTSEKTESENEVQV